MEKKVSERKHRLTRRESEVLCRMFYLSYVALIHQPKWQSDYLHLRDIDDLREMRDLVLSRISIKDLFIQRLNLDF